MDHAHSQSGSTWPWLVSLGGNVSGHCTGSTWLTILICFLCLMVIASYILIGYRWTLMERESESTKVAKSLRSLRRIFLLCAFCGYGDWIIRCFVPFWSLHVVSLSLLIFESWKFYLLSNDLEWAYKNERMLHHITEELNRPNVGEETSVEKLRRCSSELSTYANQMQGSV